MQKKISFVCDILVSTDSKKIGLIAKKRGALVPWLRQKKLSTDSSTSDDATRHAINWYENKIQKVDGLMLLEPTSPFRSLKTISNGISIFKKNKYSSVIGVEQCRHNSDDLFRLKKKQKTLKKII